VGTAVHAAEVKQPGARSWLLMSI